MAGVDLWHGLLHGADLTSADLRAADLSFSELHGAVLERSRLLAADLSNASLAGAWFAGADLRGAEFRDAQTIGASFRGAFLQSSRGLRLHGISLRQAALDAICFDLDLPLPHLVDLRDIKLPDPRLAKRAWFWHERLLNGIPRGPLFDTARQRLKTRPIRPLCAGSEAPVEAMSLEHLGAFYHDERAGGERVGPFKDWPPVETQALSPRGNWRESDFYSELIGLWIEEACADTKTARAMVRLASRPPALAEEELISELSLQLRQRLDQLQKKETAYADDPPPCPGLADWSDEAEKQLGSQG